MTLWMARDIRNVPKSREFKQLARPWHITVHRPRRGRRVITHFVCFVCLKGMHRRRHPYILYVLSDRNPSQLMHPAAQRKMRQKKKKKKWKEIKEEKRKKKNNGTNEADLKAGKKEIQDTPKPPNTSTDWLDRSRSAISAPNNYARISRTAQSRRAIGCSSFSYVDAKQKYCVKHDVMWDQSLLLSGQTALSTLRASSKDERSQYGWEGTTLAPRHDYSPALESYEIVVVVECR